MMTQYRVKRVSVLYGWEYARKNKYGLVWVADPNFATFWKRRSDLGNAFAQGRLAHVETNDLVIEEVVLTPTVVARFKQGWKEL